MNHLLCSAFLRSAELMPHRAALRVSGETVTYQTLRECALRIAATIQQRTPTGGSPLTAVFGLRSSTAFAGILGALLSGRGYVPLNRTFPIARTRWMLQNADCRSLIVDSASEEQLQALLEGTHPGLLIVLPDRPDVSSLAARWPQHQFVGQADLTGTDAWITPASSPDDVAYLLFTSGTTGVPKGVMVTHRNATRFVELMVERYQVTPDDRFSQTFDTTFDLSVFDMFVPWAAGACVCCPTREMLLNPDRFIRDHGLSVWFAVPSLGLMMKQLRLLQRGRYPSLRVSLFCGEPLPVELAIAWAEAAPNSLLDNLYGPTELTVACASYRWPAGAAVVESPLGIVPIGHAYPGMEAVIVGEDLLAVPPGHVGELVMSGPQCTPGYWRNPEATARSFVQLPGRVGVYYRTGDRVRRPFGDGPMTYLGRTDHQVKVLGYRVELGEVEARLREQPHVESAVALPWPLTPAGPAGIVAFVTGRDVEADIVRAGLKTTLQEYALPRVIYVLPQLPQNGNGKVDRGALRAMLEGDALVSG